MRCDSVALLPWYVTICTGTLIRYWKSFENTHFSSIHIGIVDVVYEEATQVVRIMFRKESRFVKAAERAEGGDCKDVLRAIWYWAISDAGTLIEHVPWGVEEKARFIERHKPISDSKQAFAETFFESIVKEVAKWIDDCALFVFGYLVRIFSENVLKEQLTEEEIWVTSFFDLNVNRVTRT